MAVHKAVGDMLYQVEAMTGMPPNLINFVIPSFAKNQRILIGVRLTFQESTLGIGRR